MINFYFIPRNILDALDEHVLGKDEESDRLTLAYENLNIIPRTLVERFGPTIKILDISHNRIE